MIHISEVKKGREGLSTRTRLGCDAPHTCWSPLSLPIILSLCLSLINRPFYLVKIPFTVLLSYHGRWVYPYRDSDSLMNFYHMSLSFKSKLGIRLI